MTSVHIKVEAARAAVDALRRPQRALATTFSKSIAERRPVQLNRTVSARALAASNTSVSDSKSEAISFCGMTVRQVAARAALDLQQRGWTVIEGLVAPEDCQEYVDSVWTWLESLGTGISRYTAVTELIGCLSNLTYHAITETMQQPG